MVVLENGMHDGSPDASLSQSDSSENFDPEIGKRLNEVLSGIEHSGSFLTAQSSQLGVNPGLHIPSIGQIRLPVSPDHAKAIIKACHASPFGKGPDTIVDNSVRNSWELNKDEFSIENPLWDEEVRRLVGLATEGLNLYAHPSDIFAESYKLLLYEEGAFFLPHQDSPKTEGMFGTLVICLPSQHSGGELIASHKGAREVFKTSPSSEYGYSSAAWYSDVTHEVKSVTSGYRIVLTYNLIHRPTAALLGTRDNECAKIVSVFNDWEKSCNEDSPVKFDWSELYSCPPSLLFMLDHEYHIAGLSCDQLKGVDQVRVGELRKACKDKGFHLYLANVTKTVSGDADAGFGMGPYSNDEESESTIELSTVVNSGGQVIANNVDVEKELFMEDEPFGDIPDDEEVEGFTGNEGSTSTHYYRRTAALIIPPIFLPGFALKALRAGRVDFHTLVRRLFNVQPNQPENPQVRAGFIEITRAIVAGRAKNHYSSASADYISTLGPDLLRFGQVTLFKELVESQPENIKPSHGRSLGEAIHKVGFSELHPCLVRMVDSKIGTISKLELLSSILSGYLQHIDQPRPDPSDQMLGWHDVTLECILSCAPTLSQEDGRRLVLIIEDYPMGNKLERFLPLIENGISNSPSLVTFLTSLYGLSQKGKLEMTEVSNVFELTLPKLPQTLQLQHYFANGHIGWSPSYSMFATARALEPANPFGPETLVLLIRQCDALSISRDSVLDTIGTHAAEVPEPQISGVFGNVILPFIQSLCHYLHGPSMGRPVSAAEKQFVVQTIETFFWRYVTVKPQPPTNWTRDFTIQCHCGVCKGLQSFIRHPEKKTEGFRVPLKQHKHMTSQLDGNFRTRTTKEGSQRVLWVSKTKLQFQKTLRRWQESLTYAQSQLKKLAEEGRLIEVIGNDSYQELETLFQYGSQVSLPTSLVDRSLNADAPASTVPQKRSFVDLT